MRFFAIAALFILFSSVSSAELLEGFKEYKIKEGDTLTIIAPGEHWDIIEKANRIDARHLIIGKIILIPSDFEKAKKFLPVPKNITDIFAERALIMYLDIQYFGAYEKGRLIFWGPVSSGKKGYLTPLGNYEMLWKSQNYISKKYKMPMPYAVNFSPAGYFMHQQSLPGQPASHGCIRLRRSDAIQIFKWIKKGDQIIVSNEGIKNALLFFLRCQADYSCQPVFDFFSASYFRFGAPEFSVFA